MVLVRTRLSFALLPIGLLGLCAAPDVLAQAVEAPAGVTRQISTSGESTPLAILDDSGVPISEKEIRRHMRKSGLRWFVQPVAFAAGALGFYLAVPKPSNQDCSEYEPCTDREKFYSSTSGIVGGFIGVLLLNAAAPTIDRVEAVARIRAERRRALLRGTR